MALSHIPTFLATLMAGWMSGGLLTKYMPKEGNRNPRLMWLIIGLVSWMTGAITPPTQSIKPRTS